MATQTTESPKTFFDSWFEGQKQLVENWYKTTENISRQATEQAQKAQQTGSEYMKNWYENQKQFMQDLNNGQEATPEPIAETQKQMNNAFEFFNNWYKNQMQVAQQWMDMTKNMGQNWMQMGNNLGGNNNMFSFGGNNTFGGNNMMQSWADQMQNMYRQMMPNMGNGMQAQSLQGMFNSSEMYMKMMEFWMPMFKNIQNGSFNTDMFKQWFDPSSYKNLMDKMFNIDPQGMNSWMEGFMKMWREQMSNGMAQGRSFMSNAYNNDMMGQMLNGYNQFVGNLFGMGNPAMKMMTPGKQRDQIVAFGQLSQNYAAFLTVQSQVNYMNYMTGLKAAEALAEDVQNKIQNGEQFDSFQKFFNNMLNINDKVFLELYSSDEYSKMQARLTESVMKLRKDVQQMMEGMLSNLPVVPRSEMDEAYKTIYELKKRVRQLEKNQKASSRTASAATTDNTSAKADTNASAANNSAKNGKSTTPSATGKKNEPSK